MASARMTHQLELERLYNKNQLMPRIREEFISCKDFSFVDYMIENNFPVPLGLALLTQLILHKRA